MSLATTEIKTAPTESEPEFVRFVGSRKWAFDISRLPDPQRITECLPSSRDWSASAKWSPARSRDELARMRRDLREMPSSATQTASIRQADSTRDLLRLVQQEADAEARRLLTNLRREVEELKRELAGLQVSRPIIDLREVIHVHGMDIPAQFRGVIAAIEASRSLLELEDDWDGNGARGYTEQTWERAAGFLIRSAIALASKSGVIADEVEILPGANGALNIDWRHDDRELLIIVPEDPEKEARFYGDNGRGGEQIKSTFDTSKTYDWLSMWLTE